MTGFGAETNSSAKSSTIMATLTVHEDRKEASGVRSRELEWHCEWKAMAVYKGV
jgi:hypothetical protein